MKTNPERHGDTYYLAHRFLTEVGFMTKKKLEPWGIVSDGADGLFNPERLLELCAFCRKNPDLHIVAYMNPSLFLNYAAPGAAGYFLGEGDANPRLVAKFVNGVSCPIL